MKKNKLIKIIFEPDGSSVLVPEGTLLSKAALAAGMPVESPCGGVGVCAKCRVIVQGGCTEPDDVERARLNKSDLAQGIRLACRARAIDDTTVTMPQSSRSMVQKILSAGLLRDCAVMSGVSKVYCELARPSLDDERADFERLGEYLCSQNIKVTPSARIARDLSNILRQADYRVTAVIYNDELLAVEAGDTTAHCYGIAYDLGSTTIVGYLMDLRTGEDLAVSAVVNPQMVYGDDLVSRISFATATENGAHVLQSAAVDALNRIASEAAGLVGADINNIYRATVVGNTCMTHLLLGIDVTSLGQSPYVPVVCADVSVHASELGLSVFPEAIVSVLPNVAGFVGSDLVGVLLASEWDKNGRTRLAVDIGTNGEMALIHNGHTYVCSAAAGPVFEGAGISSGMRGAPGAIDSVRIGDDVEITTIDNMPPIGVCGSGIVDAIAQMLDAGIIDKSGRMLSPSESDALPDKLRNRLVETDGMVEFVLASKSDTANGRPITITGGDVRHIQLAKGSIHAAIQTLIGTAGITDDQLDEILLAGAFGAYIRVESAIRIGLIPDIAIERVKSIGNAAGAGARLALLSKHELEQARKLAQCAEHVELALSSDYQTELMERMLFS